MEDAMTPRRTLVVAPSWVGDTVMALPVLEALAAADRRLHLLAKPHLHSLLAAVPAVSACVARGGGDAATVAAIRDAACEEAVVLPNSFHTAWLVRRAGIPVRWGYRGDLRSWLLAPAVARPRGRRPQIEDYRELLAAMGVDGPGSWTPRLELTADLRSDGRGLHERSGLTGAGPVIGLFAGAEFGPSKRWPLERFVELSRTLRRRLPSARQAIVAGPKEVWDAVRLHERTGKVHPVVGPDLDLARLAGFLAGLDLLVTNDSGPMHLAAALGVPCIALFGPTDPRRTAPAGEAHRVLYSDRWCSPCFRRRCPLLHHGCMKDLTVEAAAEAVAQALDGRAPV
ncbi:MAG: lipopolysaccharide heptosyltransferase II [Thermoanaerobaculia bacterium]